MSELLEQSLEALQEIDSKLGTPESIHASLTTMELNLSSIESDVSSMRSDPSSLQSDVSSIQMDASGSREHLRDLIWEVAGFKHEGKSYPRGVDRLVEAIESIKS